jgi:hypothetical protein
VLLRMKEVNRLQVLEGYMDARIEIEEAARLLKLQLPVILLILSKKILEVLASLRERGFTRFCSISRSTYGSSCAPG